MGEEREIAPVTEPVHLSKDNRFFGANAAITCWPAATNSRLRRKSCALDLLPMISRSTSSAYAASALPRQEGLLSLSALKTFTMDARQPTSADRAEHGSRSFSWVSPPGTSVSRRHRCEQG